jgi:toxin ParE1/3/4
MGYRVALTSSARRDLREIIRYISRDSPNRAVSFGEYLVASTKRLADHPKMGKIVPESGDASIRELLVRSYRVIYRVDHHACRIEVIRFWHSARGTPDIDTF